MAKVSFREQVLRAREDAIVSSVNRLLAEKGFDLMTVDEVAADVGIAKASLYKHFTSKEELAAAAMIRVLDRAHGVSQDWNWPTGARARVARLKAVARWTMQVQLAGEMPSLPAQNSTPARGADDEQGLPGSADGSSATGSSAPGSPPRRRPADLNPALPPEVILYTLFARACDPVLGLLKAGRAVQRRADHRDADLDLLRRPVAALT